MIKVLSRHEVAEQLRQLSRLYVNAQKYRNKYTNMFFGKSPYLDNSIEDWGSYFKREAVKHLDMESDLVKKISKLLSQHPWYVWLKDIKGVGPVIAASIIGELDGSRYESIEKESKKTLPKFLGYGRSFESTADLWSYAGWGIRDGKAMKRKIGEQASWNKYLKLTCYKFIESTIKSRGTYRKCYDDRKEYEQKNHPDLTKMHIENRARRYVIKKFLSDINHELILR